jgi:hypothetical protein
MSRENKTWRENDDRIMSPRQFIQKLSDSNLYDLLAFLVWYTKRGGITCVECIETRMMLSKIPPNCVECGLPTARLLKKHFNKGVVNNEKD